MNRSDHERHRTDVHASQDAFLAAMADVVVAYLPSVDRLWEIAIAMKPQVLWQVLNQRERARVWRAQSRAKLVDVRVGNTMRIRSTLFRYHRKGY